MDIVTDSILLANKNIKHLKAESQEMNRTIQFLTAKVLEYKSFTDSLEQEIIISQSKCNLFIDD